MAGDGPLPDILAPGLRVVFVGINPGLVSAARKAHFANPRNAFWRGLRAGGFTPRLLNPAAEQWDLLTFGVGITNSVARATAGSKDLNAADYIGGLQRLVQIAAELKPQWLAFVGKDAYAPLFRPRRKLELGRQTGLLGGARVFVLPSTSPANAQVPEAEKLAWFVRLRAAMDQA